MKKNVFIFLLLGACLLSCHPDPAPVPPLIYTEHPLKIIKFADPTYKNHVMVFAPKSEDTYLRITNRDNQSIFCMPVEVENPCGQSPYIELLDDYLLVDWRWQYVFDEIVYRPQNEALIVEQWTDLDILYHHWSLNDLYVTHPIQEHYVIKLDTLVAYNGKLEHPFVIEGMGMNLLYKEWSNFPQEKKDYFLKWYPNMDNSYEEYAEVLNKMIQGGVLEEYAFYKFKR